jgi:Fic family protein
MGVDPAKFVSSEFGQPYRDPSSGWDYWAYAPVAMPRELDLAPETVLALSEADAALGRLAGSGRQLHDPNIFVRPYVTREALASSRIEGTQASLTDVFQAEAGQDVPASADVQEVTNYIAAMDAGLQSDLPLVGRVVKEIHGRLMRGVRGEGRRPGEFRDRPVWIGSPTDEAQTAVFVPPFPREMLESWRDWEEFANRPPRLPKLVQCALLHYQFETIHPFFDGNGRLGRLLIVFYLVHRASLPKPLLYLSSYLEQHRREYYDRLQAVRERGEIQEWLQFFFTAIAVQAEDAIARAEQLHDLRERYRQGLAGSRSRAHEVVDLLFVNPFVTSRRVTDALGVTNQGALNLIRQLESRGWVRPVGTLGRGGRNYWLADDVLSVVSEPRGERQESGELTRS